MFKPDLSAEPTLSEIRSALSGAALEIHQIRSKPDGERGESFKNDIAERIDFIKTYDPVETALAKAERSVASESRGPSAAFEQTRQAPRSFGEQVTASDDYQRAVKDHSFGSGETSITVEGSLFQRALISEGNISFGTGGDGNLGAWLPRPPVVALPNQHRRLFVRDALTVIATQYAGGQYIQELNPSANEFGATAVAENTPKPEVTLQATIVDAPIRVIAAWVPVTNQILEDAPLVQGYIEQRLSYMLALKEEQQLLNGTGTAPQLQGIMTHASVQTQTVVASDFPATIALAIGKIENVDGEADAVAINPLNYWVAVATRHSTHFDGGYTAGAPGQVPGLTWGTTPIRSRSVTSGKAVVGSWRLGGTLLDRSETTVKLGNQHSDYFTNNKVAILAEERVGIQWNRPDWFCVADVPTT